MHKIHLCCMFVTFYCWSVFHCMDVPRSAYPFTIWRTCGWLWKKKTALNIYYRFGQETKFPSLLSGNLEVRLLGHMVHVCLTLREAAELSSKVTAPFLIPTSNVWELWMSFIFVRTCSAISPSFKKEWVVSHSFNLHLPN